MQDRCLHRSFPLSKGFREGDNLVCRYHGIRYAPDGSIARVPCQDHTTDLKLHVYPIKEVGPLAFIWMGNPDKPDWDKFPDLPTTVEKTDKGIYCNRIDSDPARVIFMVPPGAQERAKGKHLERF